MGGKRIQVPILCSFPSRSMWRGVWADTGFSLAYAEMTSRLARLMCALISSHGRRHQAQSLWVKQEISICGKAAVDGEDEEVSNAGKGYRLTRYSRCLDLGVDTVRRRH